MVRYWHGVSVNPTAPDLKPPYPQHRFIDSTTLGPSHGALWLLFPMQAFWSCFSPPAFWRYLLCGAGSGWKLIAIPFSATESSSWRWEITDGLGSRIHPPWRCSTLLLLLLLITAAVMKLMIWDLF